MTPKDKASDLYAKFYNTSIHSNSVKIRSGVAKEAAIICVQETILALNQNFESSDYLHFYETRVFEYYKSVKAEIQKL